MPCIASRQSDCTEDVKMQYLDGLRFKSTLSGPLSEGVHTSIQNLWTAGDYFSVQYDGYFYTQDFSGTFTFWIYSDDSSAIFITDDSDNEVYVTGVSYCCREDTGSISLKADTFYKIKILFTETWGQSHLTVSFAHELLSRRTDGLGFFFHEASFMNA